MFYIILFLVSFLFKFSLLFRKTKLSKNYYMYIKNKILKFYNILNPIDLQHNTNVYFRMLAGILAGCFKSHLMNWKFLEMKNKISKINKDFENSVQRLTINFFPRMPTMYCNSTYSCHYDDAFFALHSDSFTVSVFYFLLF